MSINLDDDMLPEYDFSKMKQAKPRGYYAEKIRREGATITVLKSVELDPDVEKAFPTSEAVNAALRGLMQANPDTRAS